MWISGGRDHQAQDGCRVASRGALWKLIKEGRNIFRIRKSSKSSKDPHFLFRLDCVAPAALLYSCIALAAIVPSVMPLQLIRGSVPMPLRK